jgi:hypothetical protein
MQFQTAFSYSGSTIPNLLGQYRFKLIKVNANMMALDDHRYAILQYCFVLCGKRKGD